MSDSQAGEALGAAMTEHVEALIEQARADLGDIGALAFAMAAISAGAVFVAKAQGAAYAVDVLEDIARPLRDFLTTHGGVGTGVHQ